MLKLLAVLLALYGVYLLMLAIFQRSMIYMPHARQATDGPTQAMRDEGLEQLWLDIPGGRVEAWFLPGHGVSAEHPAGVVVFAHGNAEFIDDWPTQLEPYRRLGLSVLLVEYRGYGRSGGTPTQAGITEDFVAAYDALIARSDVEPTRIVFHGRSLGGGVVMALAAERRPAAIILESTFTSVVDMAARFGVPGFLGRMLLVDPWDSISVLARYPGPTLIFHGNRDAVVPFRHGLALAQAATHSRFVEMPCGHNDLPDDAQRYWDTIREHLVGADVLPRLRPKSQNPHPEG